MFFHNYIFLILSNHRLNSKNKNEENKNCSFIQCVWRKMKFFSKAGKLCTFQFKRDLCVYTTLKFIIHTVFLKRAHTNSGICVCSSIYETQEPEKFVFIDMGKSCNKTKGIFIMFFCFFCNFM